MPTPAELSSALADLSTLAASDLRALWRQVSTADEAVEALEDVLPDLVRTYSLAAGTVAADWYDDVRDELNVDGRFRAIVSEIDDQGADVLARWGAAPLYRAEPDWRRARVLIEGGTQLRINNTGRGVIMGSSLNDPMAQGWRRVAFGGCDFCLMLAGRGAVYTERSVTFAAHDHCKCVATPAFLGVAQQVDDYTPTERRISDADRARVRDYLAANNAG